MAGYDRDTYFPKVARAVSKSVMVDKEQEPIDLQLILISIFVSKPLQHLGILNIRLLKCPLQPSQISACLVSIRDENALKLKRANIIFQWPLLGPSSVLEHPLNVRCEFSISKLHVLLDFMDKHYYNQFVTKITCMRI